jgi:AAA+ superfamily predicted ATPase
MHCKGCQQELSIGHAFCPSCGTRIQQADNPVKVSSAEHGSDPQLDDSAYAGYPTYNPFATDLTAFFANFWEHGSRLAARGLPDKLESDLVMAYCGSTRGDWLPCDTQETFSAAFQKAKQNFIIICDQTKRRLGITDRDISKHALRNAIHLLVKDETLAFYAALHVSLTEMQRGKFSLASEQELQASFGTMKEQIITWLKSMKVPFTLKHPIVIPSTAITKAFQQFSSFSDLWILPNIPPGKLTNAAYVLELNECDTVSALIDCTFFGSAKECIVIGSRAIYYQNGLKDGFLPYSDFPDRSFSPIREGVSLGSNLAISLTGSGLKPAQAIQLLNVLKDEAIARESGTESHGITNLAGMADLKQLLMDEVIAPLREPEKFRKYGVTIPNGILMYGPPGCGKTFVAQRLATELNYNFFEVGPSVVGSPYIHESSLKIRQLFDAAASSAPAVMFVDEFEGMVPARSGLGGEQQYKAEEVNEWLIQIGACSSRGILFVAATNEPWAIDSAVQRAGRLDKKVYVGPPDREAIEEILLFHLKGRLTADDINVRSFAAEITGLGYSASDLKLMVDEAAKIAMRRDAAINHEHLATAASTRVPPSIGSDLTTIHAEFGGRGMGARH